MKHKKPVVLLLLISGINICTKAQILPESKDTLHLKLNGESTTILVPHPGKKTTIIFEDTASLVQVSILKLNKGGNMFPTIQQSNKEIKPALHQRTKRWFNEIDLGLAINASQIKEGGNTPYGIAKYLKQTIIDSAGQQLSNQKRAFFMPSTSLRATLNIKESDWPMFQSSSISFISGYRLYIDYSKAEGYGMNYTLNPSSYNDMKAYSYTFFNQLVIPIGVAKKFEAKRAKITKIELGMSLGFYIKYSFDRVKSTQNELSSDGDDIQGNLASQAYLKVYRKKLFLTISKELNNRYYGHSTLENYNIGNNKQYTIYKTSAYTSLIYIGIGYRFH